MDPRRSGTAWRRWFLIGAFAMVSAWPVHATDVLRFGGGSAVPAALRKAIESRAPGQLAVPIAWESGPADVRRVVDGTLDAVLVITGPSGPERPDAPAQALVSAELLRTPILFVVAAESPERDLRSVDLLATYALQRTEWPDGTRIRIVLRPARSVDARALKMLSPDWQRAVHALEKRPGMVVASRAPEAIDLVAEVPGAITGTTLPAASFARRPARTLSIDGVAATPAAVAGGLYPYHVSIHVVVPVRHRAFADGLVVELRRDGPRTTLLRSGHVVPDARPDAGRRP